MKKSITVFYLSLVSLVLVVVWQILYAQSINFYITGVAVLIISMLPFFASFERKSTGAKEITVLATMISLAVVSRAAFYLIPQVKPIAAVVIISGVCFGAERGYIVGAFSAFISNFIFGQGMWTPFQMVAMGLIGLLAGVIFKAVKANRWTLCAVGFVLTFVLYGLIVDMSTVFGIYGNSITLDGILSVYAAGAPFSAVFGASTAVFLFLFGELFIKKIDRVNKKYGLIDK
ncbi:MAG: DUF6580 family putative transport protein [Eubacterium sp.]